MRIACPNCAAEYDVPDAALAAGPRLLRCAKCSHQFTASLPKPAPAAPQPARTVPAEPKPEPKPEAKPEPQADPAPKAPPAPTAPKGATPTSPGTDRVALLGWIATVLVLAGGVAAVVTQHGAIAEAWPPAQRLFSALGLG